MTYLVSAALTILASFALAWAAKVAVAVLIAVFRRESPKEPDRERPHH